MSAVLKPCKYGHYAERNKRRACKECLKLRNRNQSLRAQYKVTKARWNQSDKAKAYNKTPARLEAGRNRQRLARLRPEVKAQIRKRDIWRAYKMTVEEYDSHIAKLARDGCPCCGNQVDVSKKFNFAMDHDHGCCAGPHTCGKCIRAMICSRCNTAIGRFGDDPAKLRKAAEYIERFSPSAGTSGARA